MTHEEEKRYVEWENIRDATICSAGGSSCNLTVDEAVAALEEAVWNKWRAVFLQTLPRVDIPDGKTARWEVQGKGGHACSRCNWSPIRGVLTKFCPNCGAWMGMTGEEG